MPFVDADGDGENDLTDDNPDNNPPSGDWSDADGDGIPEIYDMTPNNEPHPVKDGVIPLMSAQHMRQFLDNFNFASDLDVDSFILNYVDPNGDGITMLSDLAASAIQQAQANGDYSDVQFGQLLEVAYRFGLITGAFPQATLDQISNALSTFNALQIASFVLELSDGTTNLGSIEAEVAFMSDFFFSFISDYDAGAFLDRFDVDLQGVPTNGIGDEGLELSETSDANQSRQGDPVETGTGEFFYETEDLSVPGRGQSLSLKRVYRSRSTRLGVFGWNWSSPLLETYLSFWPRQTSGSVAELFWGDGQRGYFRQTSAPGAPLSMEGFSGELGKLRRYAPGELNQESACISGSPAHYGYLLREPDGTLYYFCPNTWYGGLDGMTISWLRKVVDPYGNAITILRNQDGSPYEVIDTLGRSLSFEYYPEGLISSVTDALGQTWDYTYNLDRRELLRVDGPSVSFLTPQSTYANGRPYEEYTYSEHPDGYDVNPEPRLNHNLTSISVSSSAPRVNVEYYDEYGHSADKVKSHTIDGQTTLYNYAKVVGDLDPKVNFQTEIRYPDGELERYFHGHGLLLRREIFSGRYDSGGALIPGSRESGDPTAWWTTYTYNEDYRMTSMYLTTSDDPSIGRLTEYTYDTGNTDRFQHGNLLERVEYPDPSAVVLGPSELHESFEYDPVTVRPWRTTDALGRTTERTFGHHELDYEDARDDPTLAPWGILPTASNTDITWGQGDVNGDGAIGTTLEVVATHLPTVSLYMDPSQPLVATEEYDGVVRYSYNQFGQEIASSGPGSPEVVRTYSDGYLRDLAIDPSGTNITEQVTYDDLGRPTETTAPDGRVLRTAYDARGLPIGRSVEPSGGHTCVPGEPCQMMPDIGTHFYYDLAGRIAGYVRPRFDSGVYPTSGSLPDALEWQVQYSPGGTPSSVTRRIHKPNGDVLAIGTWLLEHDGRGRILAQTAPSGAQYVNRYDGRGLLVQFDRRYDNGSIAATTSFHYNAYGELISTVGPTDSDGNGEPDTTNYEYDGHGRLVRTVSPTGLETSFDLDSVGNILTESLSHSGVSVASAEYEYDQWDRLRRIVRSHRSLEQDGTVQPLPQPTAETLLGYGRRKEERLWQIDDASAAPRVTRFGYDTAGRLTSTEHGIILEHGIHEEYDSSGRVVVRTLIHDSDNRTGAVSPSRSTWTYEYSPYGFLAKVVDPSAAAVEMAHDPFGRNKRLDFANGTTQRYKYDSAGNLLSLRETGPGGYDRTNEYTYDVFGNLKEIKDPEGGITTFTYDELSRLETRTLSDQSVYSHEYDAADRLIEADQPGGTHVLYQYDADGRVKAVSATGADAAVARTYDYDYLGHPKVVEETVGTLGTIRVLRTFSTLGGLLSDSIVGAGPFARFTATINGHGETATLKYPTNMDIAYARDAVGRLEHIGGLPGGGTLDFDLFYGTDRARRITSALGHTQLSEFDPIGRLLSRETLYSSMLAIGADTAYDSVGNLTVRTDLLDLKVSNYDYDGFDRIEEWRFNLPGAAPDRIVQWDYDAADNWDVLQEDGHTFDYTPNTLNQLTSVTPGTPQISYRPSGEELDRSGTRALDWKWDALGRPISCSLTDSAGTANYDWRYDGLGRVVVHSSSADGTSVCRYYGDSLAQIEHSIHGVDEFIVGPGGTPLLRTNADGASALYHLGATGTVEGFVTESGGTERYLYDPFGLPRDPDTLQVLTSSDSSNQLFFLARPYDARLRVMSLGARFYDVVNGRFLSRDPAGEAAGTNLYAYARNNPLRFADATGLSPEDINDVDAPMQVAESKSGVITGPTLEDILDQWLEHNWDFLGLESTPESFGALSGRQKYIALKFAIDDSLDLLVLYENTKGDPILAHQTGAPSFQESVALRNGASALSTLKYRAIVDTALAITDLPSVALEFTASELGIDRGTSSIIASIGGSINPTGLVRRGASSVSRVMGASASFGRTAARGGARSIDDLVSAAGKKYPGKAGKIQEHHVTPKYLGGDPKGPTVPIDAAYHQEITNAFREAWPYGQGPPSPAGLQRIMNDVYSRFPLPGGR